MNATYKVLASACIILLMPLTVATVSAGDTVSAIACVTMIFAAVFLLRFN